MRWVEKFLDQLDLSLEWHSLGTMAWRFDQEESWLRIAPCPLEVVGGADDGESVYPSYSLHITALIEVFDDVPEMMWTTTNGEFSLNGKINGDNASVTLYEAPFEDEEPGDVLDPDGGIRKKKPPEE